MMVLALVGCIVPCNSCTVPFLFFFLFTCHPSCLPLPWPRAQTHTSRSGGMDAAAESTAIPPRRGFGRSNSHEPSQLRPWEAHAHVAADGCSAATRKWTKKKKTSCAAHVNTPRRRWNGSAPEPRSVPTCSGRPPWSWKPCDKHVQKRTCHEKRTSFVAFRRRSLLPPLADAFATKEGERGNTTSWRTRAALLGWQRRVYASFSNDAEVEQMMLVLQRQAMPPRGPGQVHPETHESCKRLAPLQPMLWHLHEDAHARVPAGQCIDRSATGHASQGATRAT